MFYRMPEVIFMGKPPSRIFSMYSRFTVLGRKKESPTKRELQIEKPVKMEPRSDPVEIYVPIRLRLYNPKDNN